jgi:tetratricopeptide (TPR) repeat protein
MFLMVASAAAKAQGPGMDSAVSYFTRGNSWLEKGEVDRAIKGYTFAITFKPNYAEAFRSRGEARRPKGDLAGAISDFERSIKLNPRDFAGL